MNFNFFKYKFSNGIKYIYNFLYSNIQIHFFLYILLNVINLILKYVEKFLN